MTHLGQRIKKPKKFWGLEDFTYRRGNIVGRKSGQNKCLPKISYKIGSDLMF
jgi:hypothetical protein